MINTSNSLIESVKRACTAPDYQARLVDADILAIADEVISGTLLPLIVNSNASLLDRQETLAVTDSRSYKVPYRSIGRTLRAAFYQTSSNSSKQKLSRVDSADSRDGTVGSPIGLYFEGDDFVPVPKPSSGQFLLTYPCQPSSLVPVSSCSVISSIDRTTGVVSVSSALPGVTTSTPCDFVAGKAGYLPLGIDFIPLDVSGTNIQFNVSDIPSSLAVGDYVTLAGQTCVIPLPRELNTLLTLACQVQVFQLLGDLEAGSAAQAKFVELFKTVPSLLTPRLVGGSPRAKKSPFYRR
jgi:hypothetical protein